HVEGPGPAAVVDVGVRLENAGRRVAHDDRRRPELLEEPRGNRAHLVRVAEVPLQDDGAAAELLDLRRGLLRALAVAEVVDADVGALERELQRDGPADPPGRAGDERDPPGDAAHADP